MGFCRMTEAKEFHVQNVYFLPTKAGVLEFGMLEGEGLSGDTLAASLKMRCDIMNADYALYWTPIGSEYVVGGGCAGDTARADKNFATECETLKFGGDSKIARVYKKGREVFLTDPTSSDFCRSDLATEFGIKSVLLLPTTGGVLETGTTEGWTRKEIKAAPELPKAELKVAFDTFKSVYSMYWVQRDGAWTLAAGFVTPQRTRQLKNLRGDDVIYVSAVKELQKDAMPRAWSTLINKVSSTKVTQIIEDAQTDEDLARQEVSKEFGVKMIRMVPCAGGVLEYGVPYKSKDFATKSGEVA